MTSFFSATPPLFAMLLKNIAHTLSVSTMAFDTNFGYMGAVRASQGLREASNLLGGDLLSLDVRLRDVEAFLKPQGFVATNNPSVSVTQTDTRVRDPWTTDNVWSWSMSNPFQPSGAPYTWTTLGH